MRGQTTHPPAPKPNYSRRIERGDTFIAQIIEQGNVLIHITEGSKRPLAKCFDKRNEEFRTLVKIDLFTFYPLEFGEEQEDAVLPHFRFVIEAMEACAAHSEALWAAWDELSRTSDLGGDDE